MDKNNEQKIILYKCHEFLIIFIKCECFLNLSLAMKRSLFNRILYLLSNVHIVIDNYKYVRMHT